MHVNAPTNVHCACRLSVMLKAFSFLLHGTQKAEPQSDSPLALDGPMMHTLHPRPGLVAGLLLVGAVALALLYALALVLGARAAVRRLQLLRLPLLRLWVSAPTAAGCWVAAESRSLTVGRCCRCIGCITSCALLNVKPRLADLAFFRNGHYFAYISFFSRKWWSRVCIVLCRRQAG